MIADVRSRPYSRFVPHFSKERLARLLEDEGLGYLHLGRELGGKPQKGEPPASSMTYQLRVEQPEFRQGIDRLLEAARARRAALMCRPRSLRYSSVRWPPTPRSGSPTRVRSPPRSARPTRTPPQR